MLIPVVTPSASVLNLTRKHNLLSYCRSYVIFIINVPVWFNVLWKIVKPFIHEVSGIWNHTVYVPPHSLLERFNARNSMKAHPKKGANTQQEGSALRANRTYRHRRGASDVCVYVCGGEGGCIRICSKSLNFIFNFLLCLI